MRINLDDKVFTYRVAGVAYHDGKVLLHRAEGDEFWTLPGGACEFGEDSKAALTREMKEELAAEINIGRLVWVVENFFELNSKRWHEIGLYYYFEFIDKSAALNSQAKFAGSEKHFEKDKDIKLHFEWFTLEQIKTLNIKPKFLSTHMHHIPAHVQIIVNRD
jgi:ADP-ribose pyrophosphatase YjhB (NUDIX family)